MTVVDETLLIAFLPLLIDAETVGTKGIR